MLQTWTVLYTLSLWHCCSNPMLGLPGWVASCRQGRMKLSFSFLTQWMPTVEECDPPLCSVPSLRCPAWELLGNQNQLLFLSPLSSFWLSVNCRVVFCVNSMTTSVAQTSSCHGKSSILIFLQFYCSTGTVTYVETLRNNVGICYLSAREKRWIIEWKIKLLCGRISKKKSRVNQSVKNISVRESSSSTAASSTYGLQKIKTD